MTAPPAQALDMAPVGEDRQREMKRARRAALRAAQCQTWPTTVPSAEFTQKALARMAPRDWTIDARRDDEMMANEKRSKKY